MGRGDGGRSGANQMAEGNGWTAEVEEARSGANKACSRESKGADEDKRGRSEINKREDMVGEINSAELGEHVSILISGCGCR